jgi:diacylglycerol kinase family enzyme
MKTALVINPRSAGGRTGARRPAIEAAARAAYGDVAVYETAGVGQGIALTRAAVEAGARRVVAVGGDGTANEVINGLVASQDPALVFGLLPAGTGSDLARTLGLPRDPEAAFAAQSDAAVRPLDVLEGTFTDAQGQPVRRYGVNVIGVGMGGEVVRRVNASDKAWGGFVSFLGATLSTLARWTAPSAEVRWTDTAGNDHVWRGPLMQVFVANGRYCGGGMLVAPSATLDSGELALTWVEKDTVPRMLAALPRLYDGKVERAPTVRTARAVSVSVRAIGADVPCDVDGESPGLVPVDVRVLPARLRAAWSGR